MTHPREETLIAYLDGDLAGDRAAAVEEHLVGCRGCAEELAAARLARDALASLTDEPVPVGVTAPVLREAGVAPTRPGARTADRRVPHTYRLLATAAAFVVIVGGGLVVVRVLRGAQETAGTASANRAAEATVPQKDIDRLQRIAAEQAAGLDPDAPAKAAAPAPSASAVASPLPEAGDALSGAADTSWAAAPGPASPKLQACMDRWGALDGGGTIASTWADTYDGQDAVFVVLTEGPAGGGPHDRVAVWVFSRKGCRFLGLQTSYFPSMRPSPPTAIPQMPSP